MKKLEEINTSLLKFRDGNMPKFQIGDKEASLQKKVKTFRKKMEKSWYELSEGKNTGDWIEEFDNHFKENIK